MIVELVGLVRRAVATSPLPQAQPVAAGVAISGLVDAVHGNCHTCTNIPGYLHRAQFPGR